jgi:hypothetical protein
VLTIYLKVTLAMAAHCDNYTTCYNGGECQKALGLNTYECYCKTYWDSSTRCNTTIFEAYNEQDRAYPGIGIPLYLILLALYVFEVSIDLIRKKYTPILLTKFVVIVFSVSRIVIMSLWLSSSVENTTKYARISAFIDSLGTLILMATNSLITISWLDMILRAKDLGQKNKEMIALKKGIFIACIIVCVLNVITLILNEVNPSLGIFLAISVVLLMILVICSVVVSIVYLVRIHRWMRDIQFSRITKIIKYKAKWIIVLLLMSINTVFFLMVFFVIRRNSPFMYILIDIVSRAIELVIVANMLFFLETNILTSIKKGIVILSTRTSTTSSTMVEGTSELTTKTKSGGQ